MSDDVALERQLRAAVEARQELGSEMEPAVIDAFVARIEERIRERAEERERALQRRRDHQKDMTLGAMAISIPLLAIAAVFTGLAGVIAVCVALAVIAIVTALRTSAGRADDSLRPMWPPGALEFLRELEDNNDRDWFKANAGAMRAPRRARPGAGRAAHAPR